MFNLLSGSYRVLEKAFLEDVLAEKQRDPLASVLIVSPSRQMLDHLQRQLACQVKGSVNLHFLSFYDLAERLLADSAFQGMQVSDGAFFKEMIRQVLSGQSGESIDLELKKLFGLENRKISKGLPAALAGTLKDLRDSGIRAKAALHADKEGFLSNELPVETATLALHARMVGLLERNHLETSADLLRHTAQLIPKHAWIQQQKAIHLYGFYDLTGVQLDFVTSIGSHPNATVYFPHEEGNPAYAFGERLLTDPALTSKVGKKNSLSSVAPNTSTDIWSCSGARDEVWLAAKEVIQLIDEGMAYDDIGVVSRNLGPYLSAVREIFAEHHIPFIATRGEAAGSHPLVKTIRTLLVLNDRHLHAETLRKDLEKSPYVRLTPSPSPCGRGIKEPLNKNPLGPLPVGDLRATDSPIEARWSLQAVGREGDPPKVEGEATLWSSHIRWALETIQSSIQLPPHATGEETGLLEEVIETLQDLKVLDLLNHPVTRDYFLETFGEKLDEMERPGAVRPHAGVRVMEVQQARGLPFKVLFVLGMNEKVFPRLIREDPFLSDAARTALAGATGARLGRKMNGYEEERILFALMKAAASERLVLCYQRSDEEGKALIPSVYLQELQRENTGLEPKRLSRSLAHKFEHRSPMTWTPKELSILTNRARLDPKELYTTLKWDVPGFYRLLSAHRAIETMKPGIGLYDGLVEAPDMIQPVLKRGFSPSSLEDLSDCPFQYYASNILRLHAQEDLAPGGEMTHKALGTLFHRTLELFYTACRDNGLPIGKPALEALISMSTDACFVEFSEKLQSVYPLAIKATKTFIVHNLLTFIESELEELKNTGFRPQWFEQPLEGPIPQIKTSTPITFRGKPDRMDLKEEAGNTEIRVVDYKSGKPKPWTGKVETQLIKGNFLQLPIYLGLAGAFAEKSLNRTVQASSATLRPIREGEDESTPKTLTRQFWDTTAAKIFAENMRELIGIIEKGHFYIEPSQGEWGYCARCEFARICRKEHMPTRLRAQNDATRIRVVEKLSRTAPKDEAKVTGGKPKEKTTRVPS